MKLNSNTTSGSTYSWNGPVCGTCHTLYIGVHTCTDAALYKRIAELEQMLADSRKPRDICPCSPSRGGSGICNCTLNNPKFTC